MLPLDEAPPVDGRAVVHTILYTTTDRLNVCLCPFLRVVAEKGGGQTRLNQKGATTRACRLDSLRRKWYNGIQPDGIIWAQRPKTSTSSSTDIAGWPHLHTAAAAATAAAATTPRLRHHTISLSCDQSSASWSNRTKNVRL